MIDLTRRGLPSHIVTDDGEVVPVVTDYRAWLKFGRVLSKTGVCDPHVLEGYPEAVPTGRWQAAAVEFYLSPTACPRRTGGPERPRALDVDEDGDYVVAAFMQAYGIDLTTADMHWHMFRALLRGIPDETRLSQIMGWRTWVEGDETRKPATARREMRDAWSLPDDDADAATLEVQAAMFGAVAERHRRRFEEGAPWQRAK